MPPKMFICKVCGEEVSKRKSLDLKELNGKEGRACRSHQEVQHLLALKQKREEEEKTMASASRAMLIIFAVSEIRVSQALLGTPPEFHYLRMIKLPKDVLAEIKNKVEELGEMTPSEMAVSLATGIQMKERLQKTS